MKNYATTGKREFLSDDCESSKTTNPVGNERMWTITTNDNNKVSLLSSVEVQRYDVFKQIAWRIKRSVSCMVLYTLLIVINAIVLFWELMGPDQRIVLVALEVCVNLAYLLEIIVEILTQTVSGYFSQCWNRLDAMFCLLCLVFLVIFLTDSAPQHFGDLEDSHFDTILLAIRYFVRVVRLCRFAQNARATRNVCKQDVRFDTQLSEVN